MPLNHSLPDVPRMPDPGVYELLQAMRRLTLDVVNRLDEGDIGGAGGSGAAGGRDPPSLMLDFNDDLGSYLSSTSKDLYIAPGDHNTGLAQTAFSGKHMDGQGVIVGPTYAGPSNFGYMLTKPDTFPQQGVLGWFRGDQWFTDGGEWKTIGPRVRTYDIGARYFESNVIPHHAWFDILSGNSGIQAYITSGVTPGNSVTLTYAADPEWVGKQVQIKQSFGGTVLATLIVASVSGNTVTFTTSHSVTCPWNVAAGNAPNLSFAPRTWNGFQYILVRAGGGGDNYGTIVRMQVSYQPQRNEYVHTFNGMTAGQTGGSTDFVTTTVSLTSPASTGSATVACSTLSAANITAITGKRAAIRPWAGGPIIDFRKVVSATANSITFDTPPSIAHPTGSLVSIGPDGTYATGWESQYNDQGSDVAVIAQVDSFVRNNDRADQGGRVWLGVTMKSEGARPADSAYNVAGRWRRGLDLGAADLSDGSYLNDPANSGATFLNVKWPAGARKDHPVTVSWGATSYTGTIVSVSGNSVQITPGLNANYPANSRVDFPDGGAAILLKTNQWINWDGYQSDTGRSSDPLKAWGALYGNESGVIWSGAGNDGQPYWQVMAGDARIRLRYGLSGVGSVNMNVPLAVASSISAGTDVISNGSTISANFQGTFVFGAGLGEHVGFNTVTQKFEFYVNGSLVGSIPP